MTGVIIKLVTGFMSNSLSLIVWAIFSFAFIVSTFPPASPYFRSAVLLLLAVFIGVLFKANLEERMIILPQFSFLTAFLLSTSYLALFRYFPHPFFLKEGLLGVIVSAGLFLSIFGKNFDRLFLWPSGLYAGFFIMKYFWNQFKYREVKSCSQF